MLAKSPFRHAITLLGLLLFLLNNNGGLAQWQGNFTDSITLSEPPWRGTTQRFAFDRTRGLCLHDTTPARVGNYATLSITTPVYPQMSWQGQISIDFPPTSANCVQLLLYCHEEKADGTYRYIALDLSNDKELSLIDTRIAVDKWKISTLWREKILSVPYFSEMHANGGTVDFIVSYDATAEARWSLWVRHQSSQPYTYIGSAGSTQAISTKHTGLTLACRYSKSHATGVALHHLNISPTLPSPEITNTIDAKEFFSSLAIPDVHTIELQCASPPDISQARFTLTPSNNITPTVIDQVIRLSLSNPLQVKKYILTVEGVRTAAGQVVSGVDIPFEVEDTGESDVDPQQVPLFSEFMAAPISGASEYIELYNPHKEAIDASLYAVGILRNGRVARWYPLSDHPCLIPAGCYQAFTTSIKGITDFYPAPVERLTVSPSLPVLANEGFTIQLALKADSTLIEQYRYDKALLGHGLQSKRGIALERKIAADGSATDHWAAALESAHYATPGAANSISTHNPISPDPTDSIDSPTSPIDTLHITEIMARPTVEGSEYIELFNPTGHPIATEQYAFIVVQSGHPSTAVPLPSHPSGGLPAGCYLALTPSTTPLERLHHAAADSLLLYPSMPKLPNSDFALRLVRRADNSVIEEVYYSTSTFRKEITKQEGVAQERINPYSRPQDLSNWSSALEAVHYGTPGRQNSIFSLSSDDIVGASGEIKRGKLISPYLLAHLTLQALQDSKVSARSEVYSASGALMAQYDQTATAAYCSAIVHHNSTAELQPRSSGTQMLLVVYLSYPNRKPIHLVSLLTN